MHFKNFAPMVLVLGLTSANAASIPYKLPTTIGNLVPVALPGSAIIPMSLPTVNAVIAIPNAPISLPATPVPSIAIGPARLPGVPSPLPLPAPIALSVRRFAPSAGEPFALNWSLLDDDGEAASALIPSDPGPRPLSPAGALNELRDAVSGPEPVRAAFDGRRETGRELALPHAKFF